MKRREGIGPLGTIVAAVGLVASLFRAVTVPTSSAASRFDRKTLFWTRLAAIIAPVALGVSVAQLVSNQSRDDTVAATPAMGDWNDMSVVAEVEDSQIWFFPKAVLNSGAVQVPAGSCLDDAGLTALESAGGFQVSNAFTLIVEARRPVRAVITSIRLVSAGRISQNIGQTKSICSGAGGEVVDLGTVRLDSDADIGRNLLEGSDGTTLLEVLEGYPKLFSVKLDAEDGQFEWVCEVSMRIADEERTFTVASAESSWSSFAYFGTEG